jgi:hypothetical protein
MNKPRTQAERMQRIETLVEQGFANIEKTQSEFTQNWKEVRGELTAIREQMTADKKELELAVADDVADLAKLKNSGRGIILGLTIAVGVVGVSFADAIKSALRALTGG